MPNVTCLSYADAREELYTRGKTPETWVEMAEHRIESLVLVSIKTTLVSSVQSQFNISASFEGKKIQWKLQIVWWQ
uniref:Uncharacterized protein n=1 Tax=Arion vulgaris TaxID=1028688 RepID=A0A0B7AFG8_9EUPU